MSTTEEILRAGIEDDIQFFGILESTFRAAKDSSGLADIIAQYRDRAFAILARAEKASTTEREPT